MAVSFVFFTIRLSNKWSWLSDVYQGGYIYTENARPTFMDIIHDLNDLIMTFTWK